MTASLVVMADLKSQVGEKGHTLSTLALANLSGRQCWQYLCSAEDLGYLPALSLHLKG